MIDHKKMRESPLINRIEKIVRESLRSVPDYVADDLSRGIEFRPEIDFWRKNGEDEEPVFSFVLDDENYDPLLNVTVSIDDLLEHSQDIYSNGDDGWGLRMIEDFEILKGKIQSYIDRMISDIAQEELKEGGAL